MPKTKGSAAPAAYDQRAGSTECSGDCRQHVGEELVSGIQFLRPLLGPANLIFPSRRQCRNQLLRVGAVLEESPLRVIGGGSGGNDELPIGGLRKQELARRLRQYRPS